MQSENSTPPQSGQTVAVPSLDQALTELVRFLQRRHELDRKEMIWKNIKMAAWVLFFGGLILFQLLVYGNMFGVNSTPSAASVAVIPLHGAIAADAEASARKIVPLIEKACSYEKVNHIVIDINSPGGSPNESERIVSAIEQCKAEKGKKFTTLIDGVGASAGYMVAMHGDQVVAGRYSIVGSIGAIMKYVDASSAAGKLGLREHTYKSGLVKGGPSMLSGSDADMDKLNQEMVTTLGQDFLAEVYAERKGKLKASRDEIATGRIWTAPQALQIGLIDRVATLEQLKATDFKDMKVREYRPKTKFADGFNTRTFLSDAIKGALMDLEQPEFE